MRKPLTISAIAAAFLALSGCLGTQQADGGVKHFTDVPADAPNSFGNGNIPVTVRVTYESRNGTPASGVAVLAYAIKDPIRPPSIQQLRAGNATWVARTNEQGEVTAFLQAGQRYSFATTAEGYTIESRHYVTPDPVTAASGVALALHKAHIEWTHSGSLAQTPYFAGTPLVRSGNPKPLYFPVDVKFHEDPEVNAQYVFRLYTMDASVQWDNMPPEYGDLSVRVWLSEKAFWEPYDVNQLPGTTANVERIRVASPGQVRFGVSQPDAKLTVGPTTRYSIVTPDGLDYKLTLTADFTTDFAPPLRPFVPFYNSPDASMGAVAALGGVSLFLARRQAQE